MGPKILNSVFVVHYKMHIVVHVLSVFWFFLYVKESYRGEEVIYYSTCLIFINKISLLRLLK